MSSIRSLLRPASSAAASSQASTNTYKTNIDEESNFKVCVRIRPESEREQIGNNTICVKPLDEHVLVFDPKPDATPDFSAASGSVRKNPRVLEKRARSDLFRMV
jgi:hypothetical protein